MLVVTDDAKDPRLVVPSVIIGPAEVLPVPLLRTVLVSLAMEVESELGLDLVLLPDVFGSVILINFDHLTLLLIVGARFVIEDGVRVDARLEFLHLAD